MTLSTSNPRAKQRWGALAAGVAVLTLLLAAVAQGLTQTDFELDKNATNDLTTQRIGALSGNITATATSFTACQLIAQSAPPSFTIQIGAEQMTVTAVTGSGSATGGCPSGTVNKRTYAVTRGANSTTAAAHAASGFEGDITKITVATTDGDDWDQVYSEVQDDADTKCNDIGAIECAWIHDPEGHSVYTTGGSKDDLDIPNWRYTDSSVPDADEILDAFAAKYDTGGSQFLYFGADRLAVNGAKDFGFWFFHSPVSLEGDGTFNGMHTAHDSNGTPNDPSDDTPGDILILGTFTQGGATVNIRVFEWVGSGGNTNGVLNGPVGAMGDCVPGGSGQNGCGTVNNTSVPSPWAYKAKGASAGGFIPSGGLVEGGINLSSIGLEGCFSSFLAETRSAPEVGAQLKDFVLGQFEACGSELVTTPADGSGTALTDTDSDNLGLPDVQIGTGTAGVDVTDSAALDINGTSTWSGTLDFYLCGPIDDPDTCESGGFPVDSQAVDQDTVQPIVSASANLTSVGRYCWRGEFTSDTEGVPDATDSSLGECFEVLPVTPDLDTVAVDENGVALTDDVPFGGAVYDSATLGGTAYQPGDDGTDTDYPTINATMDSPAGGTISFQLLGPGDCETSATGTGDNPESVDVTGDDDYMTSGFVPDLPGDYHWVATYDPGSTLNTLGTDHNTACDDTDEDVTVQQLQPTLDTAQDFIPNDSATISVAAGAGDLDGDVTFYMWVNDSTCGNGDLTSANYSEGPLTVSDTDDLGDTTLSDTVGTSNTTAYGDDGTTFHWIAVFESNNSAHLDVTSDCGNEHSSITIVDGTTQPAP